MISWQRAEKSSTLAKGAVVRGSLRSRGCKEQGNKNKQETAGKQSYEQSLIKLSNLSVISLPSLGGKTLDLVISPAPEKRLRKSS